MYPPHQPQLQFGRITSYDGHLRGIITSQLCDGRYHEIPFFNDFVSSPSDGLRVGLDVQYYIYQPLGGGHPFAFDVRVVNVGGPGHASASSAWLGQRSDYQWTHSFANIQANIQQPHQQPSTATGYGENRQPAAFPSHGPSSCPHQAVVWKAPSPNAVVGATLPQPTLEAVAKVPFPNSPKQVTGRWNCAAGNNTGQRGTSAESTSKNWTGEASSFLSRVSPANGQGQVLTAQRAARGWWPPSCFWVTRTSTSFRDTVGGEVSSAGYGEHNQSTVHGDAASVAHQPGHQEPSHGWLPLQPYPPPAPLPAQLIAPPPPSYPPPSLLPSYSLPPPNMAPHPPPPPYQPSPLLPSQPPLPACPPPPPPPASPLQPPLPPRLPPPQILPPPPPLPLPPPQPAAYQMSQRPPQRAAEPARAPGHGRWGPHTVGIGHRDGEPSWQSGLGAARPAAPYQAGPQGGPQYAPQPPVPTMHLNMPYSDRAARQPLPAKQQYRERASPQHWHYGNRGRPDHRGRDFSPGDHRNMRERSRDNYRRDYGYGRGASRSPPRHGSYRSRGIKIVDTRRKAAAFAEAHVRYRRRSGAQKEENLPRDKKTAATTTSGHDMRSGTMPPNTAAIHDAHMTVAAPPGIPVAGAADREASVATARAAQSAALDHGKSARDAIDLSLDSGSDADSGVTGDTVGTDANSSTTPSGEQDAEAGCEVGGGEVRTKCKAGSDKTGASSRGKKASGTRRSVKNTVAELERVLARVTLGAKPVRGAVNMRLFCGHCGKEQKWDVAGERAKPLPDPSGPDGLKRTKDGGRVLYDAKESSCTTCGNKIMCNPLSAACIYCDCQLDGFRPSYWKCSNVDGTARKRVMSGATAATAGSDKAANNAPAADAAVPSTGCAYARTCAICADYDLRYPGKSRCRCPRFHGAIAGQVTGNRAGNLGWVNVH